MDVQEAGGADHGATPGSMAAIQQLRRQTRRKQVCVCEGAVLDVGCDVQV